jgi:hypothetical protein
MVISHYFGYNVSHGGGIDVNFKNKKIQIVEGLLQCLIKCCHVTTYYQRKMMWMFIKEMAQNSLDFNV